MRENKRFGVFDNYIESVKVLAGQAFDEALVFMEGSTVGSFKGIGTFHRLMAVSLMHSSFEANPSQFGLDAIEAPPLHALYVSYIPWGGVGSQRAGLIAVRELAERLGATMIADPESFSVFDRAHFIRTSNAEQPHSVICADKESVVYHHGCAVVVYSGEHRSLRVYSGRECLEIQYDHELKSFFAVRCTAGAQLSLGGAHWDWLQSLHQQVTVSRHTVRWYDDTTLFLAEFRDALDATLDATREGFARLGPIEAKSHVKCVVLSFMGFDGAIGIPGADQSDGLSAVNAIWAKWLPAFAPGHRLREVVDAIGSALRPEAPNAHVACVHVRMTTCFDAVFEKLSASAPPVI
jgi:hypothetical protein